MKYAHTNTFAFRLLLAFVVLVLLFLAARAASASEITGTLSSGGGASVGATVPAAPSTGGGGGGGPLAGTVVAFPHAGEIPQTPAAIGLTAKTSQPKVLGAATKKKVSNIVQGTPKTERILAQSRPEDLLPPNVEPLNTSVNNGGAVSEIPAQQASVVPDSSTGGMGTWGWTLLAMALLVGVTGYIARGTPQDQYSRFGDNQ
jgi:hypothetical protein